MEALQRRLAFGNANKLFLKDVVLNTTKTLDDQVHVQRSVEGCTGTHAISSWCQ